MNKKAIEVSFFSYYDLSTRDAKAGLLRILHEHNSVLAPEMVRTTQGMKHR
jgi:hypothetical protein